MEANRKRNILLVACVALSLMAFHVVEAQVTEGAETLAAVEVGVGGISFRPSTGEDLTLTVARADFRFEEHYRGGQTPGFVPVDQEGFSLPDGLYHWELVENTRLPATRVEGQGWPTNGREIHQTPAREGRRQSGSFSISNGRVVDPSLVEKNAEAGKGHRSPAVTDAVAAPQIDDSDSAAPEGR